MRHSIGYIDWFCSGPTRRLYADHIYDEHYCDSYSFFGSI